MNEGCSSRSQGQCTSTRVHSGKQELQHLTNQARVAPREVVFLCCSELCVHPLSNGVTNQNGTYTKCCFLAFSFTVVHAVGNLHVFKGPDDFNGYGYFYVRLYWTGFGFQANTVEEFVFLSALWHIFVGLKRTWGPETVAGIDER